MTHALWRRRCLTAALGGLLSLGSVSAQTAACDPASLAYVGTDSGRIHALRVDTCAGRLALVPAGAGEVAQVPKPRWIAAHPALPVVYVASEGDGKEGSVIAFAQDRQSGALSKINEAAAGGAGTTYLWLDAPSNTLLAANFGGGSTSSIALQADGSLGARLSTVKATGSGPHRRQASPHAHGVAVDPSGRYALVADMGADRLFVYGFDRATRTLSADDAAEARAVRLPPGSGPRHLVFDNTGRFVVLLNELTADMVVLRWDAKTGRLTQAHALPTSTAGFAGSPSASEIALGRDGRFVYIGNRGENTLVVYRIDAETGALTLVQRLPAGGDAPWAFDIHASGQWLLLANNRSNSLRLFGIDRDSGRLSDTGQAIELAAPLSVAFANQGDKR